MGLDQTPASISRSSEGAKCGLCSSAMDFDTDAYTQLIERCSGTRNPNCPGRRWRHPRVDPSILLPPDPPKAQRRKPGRPPSAARDREKRDG